MNKNLIQKLLNRSCWDEQDEQELEDWINVERFAELIVHEAIAIVNKRYMGDNNREDMEVRRCVEDLKKHFGVDKGERQ